MAKQRHSSQAPESPSRGPMLFLVIGALLVAGLVAWALTRTVDVPAPVPATYTAASDTAANATYDTAGTTSQSTSFPTETATPIASATAPIVTTTHSAIPSMEGDKAEVKRISAEDLREKVKANAVTVIDVRDATAYAAAHIPGSLHIPLASVEANLDRLPKGKPIVAYCTWPNEESSAGAALILKNHGYDDVSALYGGLVAWRNLSYPLDKGGE